jgi:hypothetical protein
MLPSHEKIYEPLAGSSFATEFSEDVRGRFGNYAARSRRVQRISVSLEPLRVVRGFRNVFSIFFKLRPKKFGKES